MMSTLKATMAKPSGRAFAHIGLATATLYASSSATTKAGKYIGEHKDNELHKKYTALGFPTEIHHEFSKFKKNLDVECLRHGLAWNGAIFGMSMATYAGTSHLLETCYCSQQRSKVGFIPAIGRCMPPTPRAFVAIGALTFSPVVSVLISLASQPVISAFHDISTRYSLQETDTTTPGQPIQELTPTEAQQVSVGNIYLQATEAAIPGYATVVVPILEETFFRGMLFGRILPMIGPIPAAATSAVLFGALHKGADGSSYLPLQETLLGLLTAWLYIQSGSLLVPIAYHCGNNVWAALYDALESTPDIMGEQWMWEREFGKDTSPFRDLSPWEGIVAKNYNAICAICVRILDWVDPIAPDAYYPLLPLDFWGYEEELSTDSMFYDQATKKMVEHQFCADFRNPDGSINAQVAELFRLYLIAVFGDGDEISFDEYIEKDLAFMMQELNIHALATNPKMADELSRSGLPDAYRTAWNKQVCKRIGYRRLENATDVVTRSDEKLRIEDAINSRRMASYIYRDLTIYSATLSPKSP